MANERGRTYFVKSVSKHGCRVCSMCILSVAFERRPINTEVKSSKRAHDFPNTPAFAAVRRAGPVHRAAFNLNSSRSRLAVIKAVRINFSRIGDRI